MANNPKKVKDPTEVALSAIQEALNIGETSGADNARGSVRSDTAPANSSSNSPYDEGTFDVRPNSADRPVFEPIEEPRAPRRAANDDRETIGQILQAIQKGRKYRHCLIALLSGPNNWMIWLHWQHIAARLCWWPLRQLL